MKWLQYIGLGLCVLHLLSCKSSVDFQPALLQLDSLSTAWTEEWQKQKLISRDSIEVEKLAALAVITAVDSMGRRSISLSNARIVGSLRSDCDAMAEAEQWLDKTEAYHQGELMRLQQLRKALAEHPKCDVNGAVIDQKYLESVILQEKSWHVNFISQFAVSRSKVESLHRRFNSNKQAVIHLVDSLRHS